jgi:hypothetical protein
MFYRTKVFGEPQAGYVLWLAKIQTGEKSTPTMRFYLIVSQEKHACKIHDLVV